MDTIALDIDLSCIVGILPRERTEPQPLQISLELDLDLEPVGDSGDLGLGIDYAQADAEVRYLCTEGQFLLIESLALAILRALLRPPVRQVRVRIAKPTVLRAAIPAVELERDASWATGDPVLVDLPEVAVRRLEVPTAEGRTLEVVRR